MMNSEVGMRKWEFRNSEVGMRKWEKKEGEKMRRWEGECIGPGAWGRGPVFALRASPRHAEDMLPVGAILRRQE